MESTHVFGPVLLMRVYPNISMSDQSKVSKLITNDIKNQVRDLKKKRINWEKEIP